MIQFNLSVVCEFVFSDEVHVNLTGVGVQKVSVRDCINVGSTTLTIKMWRIWFFMLPGFVRFSTVISLCYGTSEWVCWMMVGNVEKTWATQVQVRFLLAAVWAITAKHPSTAHLPTHGRRLPCCILARAGEHTSISLESLHQGTKLMCLKWRAGENIDAISFNAGPITNK